MREYAVRKDSGEMVLDPSWRCEADVLAGYKGFGVSRVYGTLLSRDSADAEWQPVHPELNKET